MNPMVSIAMSTYEHEAFIEDAIRGVLMQQTDFPFRLVIGEDFSKDKTRQVCERYAALYPDQINLLPSEKNYGQNKNLHRILQACDGKYIALCEGDDFWTDPLKLQKQVDFLEKNPDYVLSFHSVNAVDLNNQIIEKASPVNKIKHYKGIDFFHTFVPTLAMVYRNCLFEYPVEFFQVRSTDAFLLAMLSGYGQGADLGFVGGNYRKHVGGLYNRMNYIKRYKQSIHTRRLMKHSSFFSPVQKQAAGKELSRRTAMYCKSFLKKKEFGNFVKLVLFRYMPPEREMLN